MIKQNKIILTNMHNLFILTSVVSSCLRCKVYTINCLENYFLPQPF